MIGEIMPDFEKKKYLAFNDKPSKDYIETVAKLKDLCKKEGINMVNRAFAESIAFNIYDSYKSYRKVKRSSVDDIGRLITKNKKKYDLFHKHRSSIHIDHPSLWNKDKKPFSFVSQNYGISHDDLLNIMEFCEQYGLKVDMCANMSWWFPGQTILLEFTKDNRQ